ncbi:MAG: 4Fe-4S binding protein [Christensenellaceae bacterium]|jgi:uncharacterized pyridoxamine 5'-phosphate oxidase family protein/Pyruvate/2-oxoacid:ferredoxin oxidoreductase delta subunit
MDKYLEKMREIKDFTMATTDRKGRPDTRIIDIMLANDEGVFFLTARGKNFYRQLSRQKYVSMTGLSKNWEMVSLRGRVKQVGQEYLEPIFSENPSMHEMYPGKSREILEVFCLYEGQGEFFDLSKVPIFRETFFIGAPEEEKKGYYILEQACTECGACSQSCPQDCIKEEPYCIIESRCLHCGLCAEVCPANAVERYGEE